MSCFFGFVVPLVVLAFFAGCVDVDGLDEVCFRVLVVVPGLGDVVGLFRLCVIFVVNLSLCVVLFLVVFVDYCPPFFVVSELLVLFMGLDRPRFDERCSNQVRMSALLDANLSWASL